MSSSGPYGRPGFQTQGAPQQQGYGSGAPVGGSSYAAPSYGGAGGYGGSYGGGAPTPAYGGGDYGGYTDYQVGVFQRECRINLFSLFF